MLAPLEWGIQPPENAIAAWGARGIPSGRYGDMIDLLPDRQSFRGARQEWAALEARLNGEDNRAYLPGKGALFLARRAWARSPAFSDRYGTPEAHTLYEDPECKVVGCFRGGYVMLGAYLTELPLRESPEAAELRSYCRDAVGATDCAKRREDISDALRTNRAVRFGAHALVVDGGYRLLSADGYHAVPMPKRPRKPTRPTRPTGQALRDYHMALDDIERKHRADVDEARLADAAAWYGAKPQLIGTWADEKNAVRALLAAAKKG